jgi:two-component system KDP operon response regulator KdpE
VKEREVTTVDAGTGVNVLIVAEGPVRSEAAQSGLDKLGWRPWRLTPGEITRGDVVSKPPSAALIAVNSVGAAVEAVQALASEAPGIPIIVLSDDLGLAEQALFAGAAAVLPLQARTSLVHAQLRAAMRSVAGQHPSEASAGIRVRALKLDPLRCEVTANSRRLELTPTEYRILSTLIRYAGRTLGADFLLQQSSGVEIGDQSAREIVKVHIARLRRKLEDATGDPDYILNVRNVGYLLDRRRRTPRKAS